MVTRTFLDEKQAKLGDLERQVDELRNQIDFQLRHRDSYAQRLRRAFVETLFDKLYSPFQARHRPRFRRVIAWH